MPLIILNILLRRAPKQILTGNTASLDLKKRLRINNPSPLIQEMRLCVR